MRRNRRQPARHGSLAAARLGGAWSRRIANALLAAAAFAPLGRCIPVAQGQGFAPDQAVGKMELAEGLVATLVAAEPDVRQPILVKVDDRGRLWTIQYLQYPNPAGLKRVQVDRWSRTVYDRVPEPPPHGPRGADRITILEDQDGDGRADKIHDFVDGLNLATAIEFGHGGVFVLQVPYLLFYPDANRDDLPDSDPEVLLTGFGMEDAQSLANHLTWGPDGWLYGVNGSTTTCNIRGIEFQQGIWRYHPRTREFELFCEGGGNTFGLTFDERGNLFQSTNGGPFIHAMQGAYYAKSFGKHGPLHNLYAYGFFEYAQPDQTPGSPPTGGTIYLGDSLPSRYRGKFLAGNFLGHAASWWEPVPRGSTFQARFGGPILTANDAWFGPTDLCTGPDGAIYVSDFFDQRTSHPDPDANWDRSNGRIYKIQARGAEPPKKIDVRESTTAQLVQLLSSTNRWHADRARVELAARRDPTAYAALREMARRVEGTESLQGLWGLHVSGGLDDVLAVELLQHPDASVRGWTARLFADDRLPREQLRGGARPLAPGTAAALHALAREEPTAAVRAQLLCTARRLAASDGIPIVQAILRRDLDRQDPRIDLLAWWAIESKSVSDRALVLGAFESSAWESRANHEQLRRLARRWCAEGTTAGYLAATRLIERTPDSEQAAMLAAAAQGLVERGATLRGVEQGGLFERFATVGAGPSAAADGRANQFDPPPRPLRDLAEKHWRAAPSDPTRIRLAMLVGIEDAHQHLLALLALSRADAPKEAELVALLKLLAEIGRADCVPVVAGQLSAGRPAVVQSAVLDVLGRFGGEQVTRTILDRYAELPEPLQTQARDVLFSRSESALAFLTRIDRGDVPPGEVAVSQLRLLALLDNDEVRSLVRKHFGNIQRGTPEEKLATMRRFSNDLRVAKGDIPQGKQLFQKHCATCHQLFGEGNKIGPDLTNANRADREALLAQVVDPSAVVRREYLAFVLTTRSGRVLTGLIAEQDAASVTIVDEKNNRTRVASHEIESLEESMTSLMPDKLLDPLTPEQRRDLFAYLQK